MNPPPLTHETTREPFYRTPETLLLLHTRGDDDDDDAAASTPSGKPPQRICQGSRSSETGGVDERAAGWRGRKRDKIVWAGDDDEERAGTLSL
jgi:hypothetical protein